MNKNHLNLIPEREYRPLPVHLFRLLFIPHIVTRQVKDQIKGLEEILKNVNSVPNQFIFQPLTDKAQ